MQFQSEYNKTDLVYDPFCLLLFAQLEAVKREKFPPESMRQWFIEFVRRGWNKKMLQERYDALLSTKIFGIEKLEIADWINAVPVMAMDEVNLLVKRRIESLIQRGNYLKDKEYELTEEDKKAVDLALANEYKFKYENSGWEARDNYQTERRKMWEDKFK
ncbi:MAG: hypothetical protein IPJ03_22290 [Ignavibacteriales bacterium]|nr:hypothetical protein [Ignavibacteriales bacterium]